MSCLTGTETLKLENEPAILDFWQWGFSDLRQNNLRGIFSEWLVAKILGLDLPVCRQSWDAYDLQTPSGIKIEVKSAAYLQSWHTSNPSEIRFGSLSGRVWSSEDGFSGSATYNADFYIFCLQTCQDTNKWDALDIDQWRFYILPRESVLTHSYNSIGLKPLSRLAEPLTADELRARFEEINTLHLSQAAVEEVVPNV